MFKRTRSPAEIRTGSVYEFTHDNYNMVEVAEVLAVRDDAFGIPHVRFQITYRGAAREDCQGIRVLALKAFAEHFRPVATAA